MKRFIYVFTKDAAEELAARGYTLLKNDPSNSVYVFVNQDNLTFSLSDNIECALTDTLTF